MARKKTTVRIFHFRSLAEARAFERACRESGLDAAMSEIPANRSKAARKRRQVQA